MIVLGINDGHNSSASLYEDGRLVAALSEERLRRVKNWAGFPELAIKECLRIAERRLEDIDFVALASVGGGLSYHGREEIIAMYRNGVDAGTKYWLEQAKQRVVQTLYRGPLRDLYRSTSVWKAQDHKRWSRRVSPLLELGIPEDKIILVWHHMAHASSAYYGWGRFDQDVLVLTNDGSGDRICATVNVGRRGKLECLAEVSDSESIGFIYSMTTCLLGMVPLEHEYKLMGMAPYASRNASEDIYRGLRESFQFDGPDGIVWSRRNGFPQTYSSYRYLQSMFELRRFDGICGGLQRFTEEFLTEWVRNCVISTGIRKVGLSGGVFMNVKLNKAILELPEVEELFVFPSCGDETNAIGAAYYAYAQHGDYRTMRPLQDFYTGPAYDENQIAGAIQEYSFKSKITSPRVDRIEEAIAELLANGEVVARFNGREEFGARALGNRSILADASRPEVIKVINDAIKSRDFWMPFAPSLLDRRESEYIVNPKKFPAPYMIMAFDSTERISEFRAASHPYDLTIRPQVVYRDWNPSYYGVLEAFERLTGRGILLNTSFNLHGYPIVSHPRDALHVLDESGLKYLAIGGYLVQKQG
jgi:carbamoyltransferase